MCLIRFLRDRRVIELLGPSKVETINYGKSEADFVDMQQGRIELVSGRSMQASFSVQWTLVSRTVPNRALFPWT